uniref:Uncharacterized protein n=1 Tax=Candidatus Kentrum sp. MB TaxID=2138164 RepID=A0A450X708_9GAMM|nr:MAG: hypothetical protein BECKMB1821G_GA0114241_101132 [Candidatus Kentron sp. MB]VFK29844.1 MAG: hypothetical protein BECKMB1821I_GA0114274_101222 [Candidatus Kentron sp. MB]VFK74964.1 MAG: hypothetical protein BECKMB1821H_GA0114242_101322 [Candidatus Kentron sp. MB]
MTEMTKTECIVLLGDLLVQIDTQRGSLAPGTPRRIKLDEYRNLLDAKQLELADLMFDESTTAYKTATDELKKINGQISSTIKDINKVAETFAALTSLVTAIDGLFLLATGIG